MSGGLNAEQPEVPKRYVMGPVERQMTPQEFMAMRERVAELYAEDAKRLRQRLEKDSPDI